MKIYKYPIATITCLPKNAQILHIGIHHDQLFVWVLVPTEQGLDEVEKRLYAFMTGETVDVSSMDFRGTFLLKGGDLVIHVFEAQAIRIELNAR